MTWVDGPTICAYAEYDECSEPATTEVAGAEIGLTTPNTHWGGYTVCDRHAESLRHDLLDVVDAAELDHYVASAVVR